MVQNHAPLPPSSPPLLPFLPHSPLLPSGTEPRATVFSLNIKVWRSQEFKQPSPRKSQGKSPPSAGSLSHSHPQVLLGSGTFRVRAQRTEVFVPGGQMALEPPISASVLHRVAALLVPGLCGSPVISKTKVIPRDVLGCDPPPPGQGFRWPEDRRQGISEEHMIESGREFPNGTEKNQSCLSFAPCR